LVLSRERSHRGGLSAAGLLPDQLHSPDGQADGLCRRGELHHHLPADLLPRPNRSTIEGKLNFRSYYPLVILNYNNLYKFKNMFNLPR